MPATRAAPQEFVDARRLPALQNAPQVLYYPRDPPVELKDDPTVRPIPNLSYVTFGTSRAVARSSALRLCSTRALTSGKQCELGVLICF